MTTSYDQFTQAIKYAKEFSPDEHAARIALLTATGFMAGYFAQEIPGFDIKRFYLDCGFDPKRENYAAKRDSERPPTAWAPRGWHEDQGC